MAIERRRTRSYAPTSYLPLREAIDRLFEGSILTPQAFFGTDSLPAVDMYTTDDHVMVCMAIPGANPDDIHISVTGNTLTVSGEVKHEHRNQKGQPYLEEVWHGTFQRSFTLPVEVDPDKTEATYESGILALTLPKSEATKPRRVQVKLQQPTAAKLEKETITK